jgi:DNA transposition AAA+ family ATPase
LRQQRDKYKWSNSYIATQIGYSAGAVSQYMAGKWKATTDIEERIRQFLREFSLVMDTSIATIDCEITKQIGEALEDIRTARLMGAIIGAPGIGKSRGFGYWCKINPLLIPFEVREWKKNQAAVAKSLCDAADIGELKPGMKGVEELAKTMVGSGRMILMDDAHKATRQALQLLSDFRDETGSPIALFGDERLIPKLRDDGQRLRRVGFVKCLKIKDPVVLIDHQITSLIPESEPEHKELMSMCKQIAVKTGHFGSLEVELKRAIRFHKGEPDWSWCKCLRAAHEVVIRDYKLAA